MGTGWADEATTRDLQFSRLRACAGMLNGVCVATHSAHKTPTYGIDHGPLPLDLERARCDVLTVELTFINFVCINNLLLVPRSRTYSYT